MILIQRNSIDQFDRIFRINFINSLPGFKSTNLCGTVSKKNITNLSIFNSVVHLGANPPLMGMVVRPLSIARHSLENILETGHFTINHVNDKIFKKAHQTSAKYPPEISEFKETGLKEVFSDRIKAPYVKEAVIRIGLEFKEKIEIKSNESILLVGEIMEVFLPKKVLKSDGFIDIASAQTITSSGLDAYYKVSKLSRLSYAKTTRSLTENNIF